MSVRRYTCVRRDSVLEPMTSCAMCAVADVGECLSAPCQHGGTCVRRDSVFDPMTAGYDCICDAHYTGLHCELGTYVRQRRRGCASTRADVHDFVPFSAVSSFFIHSVSASVFFLRLAKNDYTIDLFVDVRVPEWLLQLALFVRGHLCTSNKQLSVRV